MTPLTAALENVKLVPPTDEQLDALEEILQAEASTTSLSVFYLMSEAVLGLATYTRRSNLPSSVEFRALLSVLSEGDLKYALVLLAFAKERAKAEHWPAFTAFNFLSSLRGKLPSVKPEGLAALDLKTIQDPSLWST